MVGLCFHILMICQTKLTGFTLIELIMVLVVLGAMAIFVSPRFFQQTEFDTAAFQQELKTAIRYAHKLSIASGCEVQVSLTANSYALFYPNNADADSATCDSPTAFGTNQIPHPAQTGSYTGLAPAGITIASFGNFYFSALGEPSNSGTITINPGGRQIVIQPLTGFVQ